MLSIFSVYPAIRGLTSVRFPLVWLGFAFSLGHTNALHQLLQWVFVYFAVSLLCLLSCTLDSLGPLGSITADPNPGLAVSPSSTIFLLCVMSFLRIFIRFRLPSTYFGFIPDYVRLPLSGAGFRKRFSCTPQLQLPLPAFVQRLTLPRGI